MIRAWGAEPGAWRLRAGTGWQAFAPDLRIERLEEAASSHERIRHLPPHTGYISNSGGRRSVAFEPVKCSETLKLMCRGCLLSSLGAQGGLISNRGPCPKPRGVQELDLAERPSGYWGRADATGVLISNIWAADHVLADAGLADVDAEFEQSTMDAWCSPEWILATHLPDQLTNVLANRWLPRLPATDLPCPEQSESFAVPGNQGPRFDGDESGSPVGPNSAQPRPEELVRARQLRPLLRRALEHSDLVAKGQVFQLERGSRFQQ